MNREEPDGNWMSFLLDGLSDNAESYESRKVDKIEPEDNNGIGVSTAWTPDFGYETALIDANGVHPVERYKTKEDAEAGHEEWVFLAGDADLEMAKVNKLGSEDGFVDTTEIELKRIR